MADISSPLPAPASGAILAAPRGCDAAYIDLVELLFFAYRDFTSDPDEMLAADGFGRAHHRVVHFIDRNPGVRVADLLDILKVTKQSLGRVLRQLVEEGFVESRTGRADRRERRLYTTAKGAALAGRLSAPQRRRIEDALRALPPGGEEIARQFLLNLVDGAERPKVEALVAGERLRSGTAE